MIDQVSTGLRGRERARGRQSRWFGRGDCAGRGPEGGRARAGGSGEGETSRGGGDVTSRPRRASFARNPYPLLARPLKVSLGRAVSPRSWPLSVRLRSGFGRSGGRALRRSLSSGSIGACLPLVVPRVILPATFLWIWVVFFGLCSPFLLSGRRICEIWRSAS